MEITLYSIKCPKCDVLAKKLSRKGISFTLVEGDKGEDGQKAIIENGWGSAPILTVTENEETKVLTFTEANTWINNY